MRRLTATVLSLLTITGGHYLNRRWDRAALFLGLLFVGMVAAYFSFSVGIASYENKDPYALFDSYQHKTRVALAGFALIPLLSAWVTWRDAREETMNVPWRGVLPALGAVLTTLLSVVLLAYVGVVGSAYLALGRDAVTVSHGEVTDAPAEESGAVADSRAYSADNSFQNTLYLGGVNYPGKEAEPVPSGSAYLVGQVLHEGRPVKDAQVRLMINGAHTEPSARTDAAGRYSIRIPPGTWSVNEIRIEDWPDMPRQGSYMVVSGLEEPGDLNRERYPLFIETGLRVESTPMAELNPGLVVHIRRNLELNWPSPEDFQAPARVDDAVVRWSAYPGAVNYRVKISEVTRRDNTTTYVPVVRQVVTGTTELPLSSLTTLPDDTTQREYAVEVIAMTEDGTFLSENRQAYQGASFTLTDGHRLLADDKQRLLEAGMSAEDMHKMLKNDARLDAVVLLIREDMLAPAEVLLDKIDIAPAGRKLAVTGFLRARQERCQEATQLLDQAKGEGGLVCVPEEYWAGCK